MAKNEIAPAEQKFMTTKELAEVLGVHRDTVKATVEKMELGGVLRRVEIKRNSQGGYLFNEEQATLIKREIQKHHNLATRQIDGATTTLEKQMAIAQALAYANELYGDAKRDLAEARQRIAEMKPKADVYDALCNAEGLMTLNDFAKELNIKNIFRVLVDKKILHKIKTYGKGGVRNGYEPCTAYKKHIPRYFKIKEDLHSENGKTYAYSQVLLTPKGRVWLAKLFARNDSASENMPAENPPAEPALF